MPRLTRAQTLDFETVEGPLSSEPGIGFEGVVDSQSALTWVQRHLGRLDLDDFESVLWLYCGVSKQGRNWFGGRGGRLHPKIQTFLDAFDTFHDYPNAKVEAIELPKGGPLRTRWKEEWAVIQFLSAAPNLTFGKETVENPMFKAQLWTAFSYPKDTLDFNLLFKCHERSVQNKLTQTKERLLPIDIPVFRTRQEKDCKQLRFRSVVLTARAMATWFGPDAKFLIDGGEESLALYFTGFCEISNILGLGFTVSKQIKLVRKAILEACNIQLLRFSRWSSDANFLDASPLPRYTSIDPEPTGFVNATVTLNGLSDRLLSISLAGETKQLTKSQCEMLSSKSNLVSLAYDATSEKYTAKQFNDMKRAGDHGQVLHAKKYGYVIVTRDKLMALYAYALNVPFLFIRRKRPVEHTGNHPFVEVQSWLLAR